MRPGNPATLNARLEQLSTEVDGWTRQVVDQAAIGTEQFRQMIAYHLGWADSDLRPSHSPASGGKRLRPALCLLVAEALCGDHRVAAGPAVATELVHNFSLVHDDIQDGSELRRHRPTVWSLWGIPQAINVGDALFAVAQIALVAPGFPRPDPLVALRATEHLNRTCLALVDGQFLDLQLEQAHRVTLAEYQRMVGGKTAALFEAACELGALYAGASAHARAAFGQFGRSLGLAFQYQDDLLGAWGESDVTGKPGASDLRSKKKALPAALAFDLAVGRDLERWQALFASPSDLTDAELEDVLDILDRADVRSRAEQMVERAYADARAQLQSASPAGTPPALLIELIDSMSARKR